MYHSSQLWSWSPYSNRWIPATMTGARGLFIEQGREAAYGRRPPLRPGVPTSDFPALLRSRVWDSFAAAVAAVPAGRHRLHAV